MHATVLDFDVGVGDLKLRSSCMASILPTEPSPESLASNLFWQMPPQSTVGDYDACKGNADPNTHVWKEASAPDTHCSADIILRSDQMKWNKMKQSFLSTLTTYIL